MGQGKIVGEHRTSNIQLRTPNIEWGKEGIWLPAVARDSGGARKGNDGREKAQKAQNRKGIF